MFPLMVEGPEKEIFSPAEKNKTPAGEEKGEKNIVAGATVVCSERAFSS